MSVLLKVIALILLVLATLVGAGAISATWAPALLPAGLAFWCASELLASPRP